jgi:hypothetical protein
MKNFILLFAALAICISFSLSCGKDDLVNPPNMEPLITPVGTTVSTPVTATIDGAGGTLTSADGIVELNVPAGVVSSATVFSIQAIRNHCPGGSGNAYRILPEGTIFAQPVTLSFHYADTSIADERVLGIAYQDADHTWFAPKVVSLHEATNKINVETRHLSDWSLFERLALKPRKASVFINESATFSINFVGALNTITDAQGVQLNNLNNDNAVSTTWQTDAGSIFKNGDDRARYTAPGAVPSPNPVQVSATFSNFTFEMNGYTISNPALYAYVNVYKDEAYFQVTLTSSRILQAVGDSWFTEADWGAMKVLVQGDSVTVYDLHNMKAQISPGTLLDPGPECVYNIIDPGDGPFNTPDTVKMGGAYSPVNHQVYIGVISFNYPTGQTHTIEKTCTGVAPLIEGGDWLVTGPVTFGFDATLPTQDITQVISGVGILPDGFIKIQITRIQ